MTDPDSHLLKHGYAPGGYWHRHCSCCDDSFIGDKRATTCRQCATVLYRQENGSARAVDLDTL
jgi:hypothetical protein